MEISQALASKTDAIIQSWVQEVRRDDAIQAAQELTYRAIQDGIPYVLRAIVTLLSNAENALKDQSDAEKRSDAAEAEHDVGLLVEKSLEHGVLRAHQGYDAEEVAREYRLLRQTIFSYLEDDLLEAPPQRMLKAVRLIDATIDEVIGRCFQSYTEGRLDDLAQIHSQLQLTNQELERLVKAQRENTSRLVHDLKSPLTSIIGYSNLFLRKQQSTAGNSAIGDLKSIEQVLRSSRHLLRLINDVLEMARCEDGQMRLEPQPTDICELIDGIVAVFEPLARERALDLSVSCQCGEVDVVTDPLRLQQVLTNLISNAIRYTPEGHVKVSCQRSFTHQLAIAITDTGVGIAAEDQARIFDPYYQGTRTERLPDSTGLGLAIVAQLVELLQGQIQVRSQLDVGTTFTVTLPLQIQMPSQAAS